MKATITRSRLPQRPWLWLLACLLCAYGLWLLSVAAKSCPAASTVAKRQDIQHSEQQSDSAALRKADVAYAGSEGPSICADVSLQQLHLPKSDALISPLVIVAHNRVTYLARTMMNLLKYWTQDASNAAKFPLYISVDGSDPRTLMFAADLRDAAAVQVISRVRDRENCDFYDCHISLHFKMLLQLFFQCLEAPRLLFLEEDLEVWARSSMQLNSRQTPTAAGFNMQQLLLLLALL